MLGLAAILLYYVYPPMDHGLIRIALGMQLGGALGNLIDRVRLGEVTDFVDVGCVPDVQRRRLQHQRSASSPC